MPARGVPECSGEHFTWPNTAPRCPGMPQGLRRMAPALAPALALVATCNGTIDAGIPPLGHDTTSADASSPTAVTSVKEARFEATSAPDVAPRSSIRALRQRSRAARTAWAPGRLTGSADLRGDRSVTVSPRGTQIWII